MVLEVHLLDGAEVGQVGEGSGDALPLGLAVGALDGHNFHLGQIVEGLGQRTSEGVLTKSQHAQIRQGADLVGNLARQIVLVQIQMGELIELTNLAGQRTGEASVVEIQLPEGGDVVDLVGDRPAKGAVGDVDLLEGRRHLGNAGEAGDGGVAQDQILQILGVADVAKGNVDGRVVPEVEDLQIRQVPHLLGEGSLDVVLAQVYLADVPDPLVAGAVGVGGGVARYALPGANVRGGEPIGVVGPFQALGFVVYFEQDLHGVEVGAVVVVVVVAIVVLGHGGRSMAKQPNEEAQTRENEETCTR